MPSFFSDREDAGRQLGAAMPVHYREREDVIVLGLPRGGIPVARQVTRALGVPLDAAHAGAARSRRQPGRPAAPGLRTAGKADNDDLSEMLMLIFNDPRYGSIKGPGRGD